MIAMIIVEYRKIGLNDASYKKGMELRLLHGVAKGEPWFGRWGYRFGSGTYGVTQKIYEKALETVRNVPLCLLNHHLTSLNRETPILLSKYQALSTEPLITLSDLFMFMLHLHSRLPRDHYMNNSRNQMISIDSTNCRWSQKRIQMAIKVVIESLKRVECRWISRQEVRDAARNYIGDTGLLDFVLKSLGNQVVGNYLVRRSLNPVKKVLEYCLEDITNLLPSNNHELIAQNPMGKTNVTNGHNKITRGQVMKDMVYFYKHILMDYKGVLGPIGILNQIGMASRAILDAKYFIKEYHHTRDTSAKTLQLDQGGKLGILCTIARKCLHHDNEIIKMSPQECIVVNKGAILSEVYREAERVFREIYWELRDVVVDSMAANGQREIITTRVDEIALDKDKGLVLEGNVGMMMNIELMKCYGKDDENKKKAKRIECECGAKEDDGERMVCCDICEVWQHTRCVGVQHNEEVPRIFLCQSCDQHLIPLSFLP